MYWVRNTDKALNPCVLSRREKEYTIVWASELLISEGVWLLQQKGTLQTHNRTHTQEASVPDGGTAIHLHRQRRRVSATAHRQTNLTPIVYDEFFHFHRLDYPAVSALCVYVCLYVCIKLHCVENQTLKSILILRYMYLSTSVVFRDNIVLSISH